MLCSVIIIWFILITFIIIYYLDDCKKVVGGENKIIINFLSAKLEEKDKDLKYIFRSDKNIRKKKCS